VAVSVLVEGRTRERGANRHVLALLAPALGGKLRVVDRSLGLRVHAKLYAFDGPEKSALIGSFNPSGDAVELEPRVIDAIGDQDRGFNLLAELREPALVDWLFAQTERLHTSAFARMWHLPLAWPRSFARGGDAIWLLPRYTESPLLRRLRALPADARVRLTATHLSGRIALRHLAALTARGVRVEALGEDTERRVPRALEAALRAAGIAFTRVTSEPHVPMHAKFTLIEAAGAREAWFGSANWSDRSFRRNFELLVRTRDASLCDALSRYWERIERFAHAAGPQR
jgi:phosphatidylserine/phosphatidylglycerophosphate/cardiolipin synthase-like enzyme